MAVGALPRNPYTVGGPVRGLHFYGRKALIQAILDGNDRSIWVVGKFVSGQGVDHQGLKTALELASGLTPFLRSSTGSERDFRHSP